MRVDIFLFRELCNKNKIDTLFSHHVYSRFQPRHGPFVVDEVLHFVQDKNAVSAHASIVKIAYDIIDVLDRVVTDVTLVDIRYREQTGQGDSGYVREKRTMLANCGNDDIIHRKKTLPGARETVMNSKYTRHKLPLCLRASVDAFRKGKVPGESPTDNEYTENKDHVLYRRHKQLIERPANPCNL